MLNIEQLLGTEEMTKAGEMKKLGVCGHVTIENESKQLLNGILAGPDFIGVGPEKTGTTWIYSQLDAHPHVQMPRLKELRYFWESHHFPDENPLLRLLNRKGWHRHQYRQHARNLLRRMVCDPINTFRSIDDIKWDISYLLRTHNIDWYLSRFPPLNNRLQGEISPQYFFLDLVQIYNIKKVVGECKIIITLRDPIGWIWSFIRMLIKNGSFYDDYQSIESFIDRKRSECSYANATRNWLEVFGEKNVGLFFYDHLEENPWEYYREICSFMEIEPDLSRKELLNNRVNAGTAKPMKVEHADRVRMLWANDITELATMFENIPTGWIEELECKA